MAKQRAKTRSSTQDKELAHDRKKKRTLYAMTGILVFLMVFSIFGIMLYGGDVSNSGDSYTGPTEFEGFTFGPSSDPTLPWQVTKTPFGKGNFKGELFVEPVSGNYEAFFHPSSEAVIEIITQSPFVILNLDTRILTDDAINNSEYISFLQAQEISRLELSRTLQNIGIDSLRGITQAVPNINLPVYTCENATSPTIEFVTTQLYEESTIDGIHIDKTNPFCIRVITSFELHTLQITDRLRFALIS
jgi:hypothetical protein